MLRRHIPVLLTLIVFSVLTASATDFWLSKEWHQWSDDECDSILHNSPWSHTWTGGHIEFVSPGNPGPPQTVPDPGQGFGREALLAYVIQIRSSLPVREAIVRKQQFANKYEKMAEDQRANFDAQASKILNRSYSDAILVHVDFSRIGIGPVLSAQRTAIELNKDNLGAFLLTDDGSQIKATRVDVDSNVGTFDAIFRRLVGGALAIKDDHKHFSFRFESPVIHVYNYQDIPAERVSVHFDLSKMHVNGKPNF
jgi:hypothetical protein